MNVDTLTDRFGIDDRRLHYLRYRLRPATRPYRRSIDGTTARFHVETFREYRRVRTLMYEDDVLVDLLREVSPDDVFYDVGANVGVYTCFVGQHADRVVAIEPHERTAGRLRENVAVNGIDAEIQECALADAAETTALSHPRRSPSELGTGEFSLVADGDSIPADRVEVIPGDELIRREGLSDPSVAKIDVEGAELRALRGLQESLSSCDVVYVEVHRDHVRTEEVIAVLASLGFGSEVFHERGNTTFLKATIE